MTSLKARLMKALEFKPKLPDYETSCNELSAFQDGQESEYLRRMPIHQALADVVEALEFFKYCQCDCTVSERLNGHLVGCWKPEADEKLEVLAKLEEAIKKVET